MDSDGIFIVVIVLAAYIFGLLIGTAVGSPTSDEEANQLALCQKADGTYIADSHTCVLKDGTVLKLG